MRISWYSSIREFIWKYGQIEWMSGNIDSQQLQYNGVIEFLHKLIWMFSKERTYFWLFWEREKRKFKD